MRLAVVALPGHDGAGHGLGMRLRQALAPQHAAGEVVQFGQGNANSVGGGGVAHGVLSSLLQLANVAMRAGASKWRAGAGVQP